MEKKSAKKKILSVILLGMFSIGLGAVTFLFSNVILANTRMDEEVSYRFVLINQGDTITGYAYYPFREVPLFHQRKNVGKAGINASVYYHNRLTDLVSFYGLTLTDDVVPKPEMSTKFLGIDLPENFFPDESFGEMKIIFDSPNGNWKSDESITKSKYVWSKATNSDGEEFEYTVADIVFWFDQRGWDSHLRDPYGYCNWEDRMLIP